MKHPLALQEGVCNDPVSIKLDKGISMKESEELILKNILEVKNERI